MSGLIMKAQPHAWGEYAYHYANDNNPTPRRVWLRDDQKIYQIETGEFIAANNSGNLTGVFKTFEEAEKAF